MSDAFPEEQRAALILREALRGAGYRLVDLRDGVGVVGAPEKMTAFLRLLGPKIASALRDAARVRPSSGPVDDSEDSDG